MEWHLDKFIVSDDRTMVNVRIVTKLLGDTYWGHRRPLHVVEHLIGNSLCFSMFSGGGQIGFARLVTDRTVFSWLSDLVIEESFRGKGLGRWFMECILNHPDVAGTQFVLQTRSAHRLYEQFGFELNDKLMTRLAPAYDKQMEPTRSTTAMAIKKKE